jgi:2,3-diketo-5-methylthio-1-phosphopentane phosphatase
MIPAATTRPPPARQGAFDPGAPRALRVFCDFDGTFSLQDVGATLAAQHLAERRKRLWTAYERGEVDAWEYAVELFDGFCFSAEAIDDFLAGIALDPGARSLLGWCSERSVPFRILSDGFDHNLDRMQALNDVRFEYRANHLELDGDRWRLAPGHRNPACGCGTGCCKRHWIETQRQATPSSYCVHVGNGRVSDLCGAETADLAFAKDTLAPALEARGVPYEPYATLYDVVAALDRAWNTAGGGLTGQSRGG